jgi:excisionase family DNA binding protein
MSATSTAASELPEFPWPKETMTVAEVAATIGRTPKTVRQHIQAKRLRAVQFEAGGPYSIHRNDAQAWVASFVVGQQAREGLDRMVNRRRAGLAGTPRTRQDERSSSAALLTTVLR